MHTYVVFRYLSKAFDTIDHDILLRKLLLWCAWCSLRVVQKLSRRYVHIPVCFCFCLLPASGTNFRRQSLNNLLCVCGCVCV